MTEQAVGTILSIAGKIFARILLNRLSIHITPEVVPETQCGFRAMLDEAFQDMGDGGYIQSRQSTGLFNVAHFRAKAKTTWILIRELLFAHDSALVAHSAEDMQKIVDAFSNASKKFGLKINIKKTEMLCQPNSTRTREEDIMVDGNKLNFVLEFTYFRSTISNRLPQQILYYQLSSGHRKRGRPRLRFKDIIKRNMKLRDIDRLMDITLTAE
ncbi:hypothetical protein NP493_115g01017 [Ridgeia piscesae]|uniref:Reverse transcriptase domain-containing protein n=1 Tax=Ridgeia piscesae TaxID=27915 RepID=A0AAD9UH12_RIDPI|nr:hypothetical protein NP493_115g01017 [Ridgeia piscesae]